MHDISTAVAQACEGVLGLPLGGVADGVLPSHSGLHQGYHRDHCVILLVLAIPFVSVFWALIGIRRFGQMTYLFILTHCSSLLCLIAPNVG